MKFKKIISLMLACALTFNSSVVSFASAETETELTVKVNDLEKQLIVSETENSAIKSKIENVGLNHQKIFEELEKQNKEFKKSIKDLKNEVKKSSPSLLGSLFKMWLFGTALSVGLTFYIRSIVPENLTDRDKELLSNPEVKKQIESVADVLGISVARLLEKKKVVCPKILRPIRDYGENIINAVSFLFSNHF